MREVIGSQTLPEIVSVGLGSIVIPTSAIDFLKDRYAGKTDGISCWRSYVVERREGSKIDGRGLFAMADILADTLVAIKTGRVFGESMIRQLSPQIGGSHQQIGHNSFLAGVNEEEANKNLVGYNHECEDPAAKVVVIKNVPLAFLVSRRTIEEGEEVATDYSANATSDTHRIQNCKCGSRLLCRGLINPAEDYKVKDIQEKYKGEFPDFVQAAIDKL